MSTTLKDKVRRLLLSDHSNLFSGQKMNAHDLENSVRQILDKLAMNEHLNITEMERKKLINELIDEFIGLGPLENILRDPSITEIMINGPKVIYVERAGKTELINTTFDNEQQLMYVINKILSPTRRHVDETTPYTDVSLEDGSRVNIIIPPLALDGPTITIRKFLKEIKSVDDLVNLGTLDKRMADFLVACVKAKMNIIFAGATGSGKTTTVNVLSSYIPSEERIITIEDTAELHLSQAHVVRLETKQPNIEGKGEITIRDLFKNSLRMRPGRIILGEIRGSEALDMLQAMCSGHTGAFAVLHAESPQDVVYRLETMVLTAGIPITLEAIHRQIASAIHLVVQQSQLTDGTRKITHITQVNGLSDKQTALEDIFRYDIDDVSPEGKISGRWVATGANLANIFVQKFKKSGIKLPPDIFKQ